MKEEDKWAQPNKYGTRRADREDEGMQQIAMHATDWNSGTSGSRKW
jgi:hypothetical protein